MAAEQQMALNIPALQSGMQALLKRGDIFFAVAIMAIIMVLLVPIPKQMLDFLLSISITVSVLILMTVLFVEKPLQLSSFPTILLIATMLRLSLNIASVRLILSHGHLGPDSAGQIIKVFGTLVTSGQVLIGGIIFIILTIINFVVITKGSGRIAEVSARFSLDAMPGKQMAIDADLSAGLIDENVAKTRRKELEDESAFYGAMDGASKFVRGDAIAGILITFINFVGGIIIGTVQKNLSFAQALQTYTVLTVGDGLVSQIPALIVSTAAGLLVTKAGTLGSAEKAVLGQLTRSPSAIGVTSGLLIFIGSMLGFSGIAIVILGAITGYVAWKMSDLQKKAHEEQVTLPSKPGAPGAPSVVGETKTEEQITDTLHIDNLRLELGYALLPLINYQKGNRLTEQIKALRKQMARDLGFIIPPVRIQDNMQLPPNTYVIKVKEVESGRGELKADMLLVMNPSGGKIDLPGEETTEPTFGLPAMWIPDTYREEAQFKNYTVVDPPTVLTTHLTEIVKDNMPEMLSYVETQKLIDDLPKAQQKLISEVIPTQITISGIQRVLQSLLAEHISIRDLPTIIEAIAEGSRAGQNITMITEHVRTRLSRQISHSCTVEAGYIPIVSLSPVWEQTFVESITGSGAEERTLNLAPSKIHEFISLIRKKYEQFSIQGENPVLLTSPQIRPYVRSIIERFRAATIILSQNEIHPRAKIKTLGQI
jgi:flagellar biosynthesis protein FlhA